MDEVGSLLILGSIGSCILCRYVVEDVAEGHGRRDRKSIGEEVKLIQSVFLVKMVAVHRVLV